MYLCFFVQRLIGGKFLCVPRKEGPTFLTLDYMSPPCHFLGKILLRILDLRNAVFHQLSEKALRCCCVTQPFSPNLSSFYKMQYCILLRCINEPTIDQWCDFSKPITNQFGTWYECLMRRKLDVAFLYHILFWLKIWQNIRMWMVPSTRSLVEIFNNWNRFYQEKPDLPKILEKNILFPLFCIENWNYLKFNTSHSN